MLSGAAPAGGPGVRGRQDRPGAWRHLRRSRLRATRKLPRGSLRFDPASGLFGLVPVHAGGISTSPTYAACSARRSIATLSSARSEFRDWRRARRFSSRASTASPRRSPRPGSATPLDRGAPALLAEADRLFGKTPKPPSASRCPKAPAPTFCCRSSAATGGRSASLWSGPPTAAYRRLQLIDAVAPSSSPAWFVRQFRCDVTPVCDAEADTLMDAARQIAGPGATLRTACRGGGARSTMPYCSFRSPRRCAGRSSRADPGLCREPLRRSHAHRPGAASPAPETEQWRLSSDDQPALPGRAPTRNRCGSGSRRWNACSNALFVIPGIKRRSASTSFSTWFQWWATSPRLRWAPTSSGKRRTSACRNGRWRAWRGNVGVDWLLGLIPWVGAIPTFFFRSNTRNLRIIKRHLDKHHAGTRDDRGQVTSLNSALRGIQS